MSVKWRHDPGYAKVEIYRDSQDGKGIRYVTTILSGNVFNDSRGDAGDSYRVIAHNRHGRLSDWSATRRTAGTFTDSAGRIVIIGETGNVLVTPDGPSAANDPVNNPPAANDPIHTPDNNDSPSVSSGMDDSQNNNNSNQGNGQGPTGNEGCNGCP